jgi:glucokinase
MKPTKVLAIDCGGTFIKAGLITETGDILAQTSVPTNVQQGRETVLAIFQSLIEKYKADIEAVGMAFAAPLDYENGIIWEPVNFPKEWHNFALAKTLTERTKIPIYLQNDAKLAALGEYWKGAGQGVDVLVVLTLGTGVGGGIIFNGNLWLGASKIAGELGHLIIATDGPRCGCGKVGCLETFASCTAVVRMAEEARQNAPQATKLTQEKKLTAERIYQIAKAGDATAQSVFVHMGQALAKGIANICHVIGPRKIVLTAGGAGAWDMFYPALIEMFSRISFKSERDTLQLTRGILGEHSGILGAAYWALQRIGKL